MNFGDALKILKAGGTVQRDGWNGKGMFLELQVPDAHSKMSLPYVFMFTACKNRVPWLASQTDILADDWRVVSAPPARAAAPAEPVKPLPPELTRFTAGSIAVAAAEAERVAEIAWEAAK